MSRTIPVCRRRRPTPLPDPAQASFVETMSKKKLPQRPHDRSRRLLYHHPRTVRDLVRGFVAEPWVDDLDFDTLVRVPSDHISAMLPGEFEDRSSDVIWKVRWQGDKQGKELYLLILVELQSTCEQAMALRVLGYVVMLYLRLIKERHLKKGERLPPILPLIVYNGDIEWWAPLKFEDLVDEVPESFKQHVPQMTCCLVDEKRVPAEPLRALVENVAALIFRTEQSTTTAAFQQVVEDVGGSLSGSENRELVRDLLGWFAKVVIPLHFPGISEPDLRNVHDLTSFVETKMVNFVEQAKARGRQEGLAEAVLQLLARKFEAVPEDVRARVLAAEVDSLSYWIGRIMTASSIPEVFSRV